MSVLILPPGHPAPRPCSPLQCASLLDTAPHLPWASLVAQRVKNLPAMWETRVRSLGWKDFLKKGMATQSSILAWRIPWTDKPGWLQSMGHKESDMTKRLTHTHTCTHTHTHTQSHDTEHVHHYHKHPSYCPFLNHNYFLLVTLSSHPAPS